MKNEPCLCLYRIYTLLVEGQITKKTQINKRTLASAGEKYKESQRGTRLGNYVSFDVHCAGSHGMILVWV
jgi:hypothetical protein